jgi:hypothetical protein
VSTAAPEKTVPTHRWREHWPEAIALLCALATVSIAGYFAYQWLNPSRGLALQLQLEPWTLPKGGGDKQAVAEARIGSKGVVVFKSDSHLSQDVKVTPAAGVTLPNEDVWRQIIDEVRPRLVITTGTAGGIGSDCEVGDVVVSPIVTFDCQNWLHSTPFHNESFRDGAVNQCKFPIALELFNANASGLLFGTYPIRRSSRRGR